MGTVTDRPEMSEEEYSKAIESVAFKFNTFVINEIGVERAARAADLPLPEGYLDLVMIWNEQICPALTQRCPNALHEARKFLFESVNPTLFDWHYTDAEYAIDKYRRMFGTTVVGAPQNILEAESLLEEAETLKDEATSGNGDRTKRNEKLVAAIKKAKDAYKKASYARRRAHEAESLRRAESLQAGRHTKRSQPPETQASQTAKSAQHLIISRTLADRQTTG